jgi:hypothetical protein
MLGSFIVIKDILEQQLYNIIETVTREYIKKQYGWKAKICSLKLEEDRIVYDIDGAYAVTELSLEAIRKMRSVCGQTILTKYGLPMKQEEPHTLALLMSPSLIKRLGIMGCIKLYNDWKGDSKVGDLVVIKYV